MPAFVFVRNFVSALVFFVVAVSLYGFEHFADAFAPGLVGVMLVYALVVVAIGQLAWYQALSTMPPPVVVSWSMATTIIAILFAFLLLGERPSAAQWIGGGVIIVGMVLSRPTRARDRRPVVMENSLAAG